jgi:hypothetical protein
MVPGRSFWTWGALLRLQMQIKYRKSPRVTAKWRLRVGSSAIGKLRFHSAAALLASGTKGPLAGETAVSVFCGSRTCKPNSVHRIAPAGRSFLWAAHYCAALATYPEV